MPATEALFPYVRAHIFFSRALARARNIYKIIISQYSSFVDKFFVIPCGGKNFLIQWKILVNRHRYACLIFYNRKKYEQMFVFFVS